MALLGGEYAQCEASDPVVETLLLLVVLVLSSRLGSLTTKSFLMCFRSIMWPRMMRSLLLTRCYLRLAFAPIIRISRVSTNISSLPHSPYSAHMHSPLDTRLNEFDISSSIMAANPALAGASGANGNSTDPAQQQQAAAPQPTGPLPGMLPSDMPGPLATLSVDQINERDAAMRQAAFDRLEAESRGYESVFSA